jgi:acyl-coenzyme A synthetase/AMP-(fatty) acid ligase
VTDTGWAKAAWGGLFGQWHERATVVQVALGGRPEADTILNILADHKISSFCAPPTLYRTLVHADLTAHDPSALRHCTSAGEPLNPEVIRAWREGTGGLTVYDGYGQTETTCTVANYRAVPAPPGSMGKPVLWVPKTVSHHVNWAYMWLRPPSRSRRRMRHAMPSLRRTGIPGVYARYIGGSAARTM